MSNQRYLSERPVPHLPNDSSNDYSLSQDTQNTSHIRPDSPGIIKDFSVRPFNKPAFEEHMHDVSQTRRARWRVPKWKDNEYLSTSLSSRSWSMGIVSLTISIAAFLTIVIILGQYNQHASPSLPFGITFNTVIVFLTAISQLCFLYPVVQGLSQIRWDFFNYGDHPLHDFKKFDDRQGAWGSILLTFSTKGRLSALLAAVLLIISAVVSTLTQAVLNQSTRYVPGSGSTSVLRAIDDSGINFHNVNDAMTMMMNAMTTRADDTYDFNAPSCPTGNCKYPSFGSLAVCAKSHDVSDKLYTMVSPQQWCYQQHEDKWNGRTWGPNICSNYSYVALSPDIYLDYFGAGYFANITNMRVQNGTWNQVSSFDYESFAPNGLNSIYTIYLDSPKTTWNTYLGGLPDTDKYLQHTRAVETLFYVCAQEFSVSTIDGTTVTNVTETLDYVTDTQLVEYTTDNYHYTPVHNRTFVLNGHNYSYYLLSDLMSELLDSFLTGKYNNQTTVGMLLMTPFSLAIGNAIYHNSDIDGGTSVERGSQMQQALEAVMNNTAKGITNWLRTTGTSIDGEINVLESFVIVKWRFLILLGVQISLSVYFSLSILWKRHDCSIIGGQRKH